MPEDVALQPALSRRDRGCAVALGLAAAIFFGLLSRYGLNIGEEGGTTYLIARTAAGQRPYLDFVSGYTPAYFYWNALLLRLFGSNLLVLRSALVVVHSLTVALFFGVARSLLPRRWAILASLVYPALLPVVPNLSCSFNVVYPTWYASLFWVVSTRLLLHWTADRHLRWLALVGLLTGLSFSFKPNTGLFNLAAAVITVACVADPRGAPERRWFDRSVWLAGLLCSFAGVLLVLRANLLAREGLIFALPLGVVVALGLTRRCANNAEKAACSPALLTIVAGFLASTVPWLGWYWRELGWDRFTHDVLFVNTGYEEFFYQAYRYLGWRDALLALTGALLAGFPDAIKRQWRLGWQLAAAVGVAASASATWFVLRAPMPQGFQQAVLQRLQDWSFGAVLLIHAALILWLWRALKRRSPQDTALLVVGVSAVCCFLTAYPRSDFFHLACATPFSWLIGIAVLWHTSRRWQRVLPTAAQWVGVGVFAALLLTLAIAAAPQLQLAAEVAWHIWRPASSSLTRLDLKRAPLLVQRGVAPSVRDLVPLVPYLESASGEGLFTFPNLDLICFLSGRDTPARIGYFNPGWPDHLVEAEVVDDLEANPPALAVVADPASLFFADAPAYYVLLGHFLEKRYVPAGHLGSYTVLRRLDIAVSPIAPPNAATIAGCDDPLLPQDPRQLRACLSDDTTRSKDLLQGVRDSESPEAAAVVARWWVEHSASLDSGDSMLALRIIGELGDHRSAKALLDAPEPQPPQRDAWATALFNIALRGLLDPLQWGRSDGRWQPAASFDNVQLRDWLEDSNDVRLRFFAAWALGQALPAETSPDDANVAMLRQVFDSGHAALVLASGAGLVRTTSNPELPRRLLQTLDAGRTLVPGLLREWQRRYPVAFTRFAASALANLPETQALLVALLAGLTDASDLTAALHPLLSASSPRLRAAAVWSLGESGNRAALPLVHIFEADRDASVRNFATAARRQLEAGQ